MINRIRVLVLIFFLTGLSVCNDVLAWDDGITHKDISEYASKHSVLDKSKGDYLKSLGLSDGLYTWLEWSGNRTIKEGYIIDWLREGAMLEDSSGPLSIGYIDGKGRSFNHFHNALKQAPWQDAGLNDQITFALPVPPYYVTIPLTGKSSIQWAQDGAYERNFYEGDWSWGKIREYLYAAITGRDFSHNVLAIDASTRLAYFARAFRGLGHQMHLLQDMAVPDHVRNDAHHEDALFGKNPSSGDPYFESWAKNNAPTISSFASKPIFPEIPFNVSHNGLAPITQLYDTDEYDGITSSAGINQGLAEYTNSNFFSDDTIFAAESYTVTDMHYFPLPRLSSTDLQQYLEQNKLPEVVLSEDNIPDTSFYIQKKRDGEEIEHFVKPGYFTDFMDPNSDPGVYYRTFLRDEKCHEDYDRLLIPRAVGYSAALLDYFFRGSMEVSLPMAGVYAEASPDQGFTRLNLLAKNTSSTGENMDDGDVELIVIYRLAYDDPFQNYSESYDFWAADEYSYIVVPEADGVRSIPRDNPVELTFDLTNNPIPLWAIDVNLQLVYHGKLGMEDNAVVVALKDISEPTPIDIMNDMDQICLNDIFYTAGTQDAIDQVDSNNDGIPEWDVYSHNIQDIYLKISSPDAPAYASPDLYDFIVPALDAGDYQRVLYILTDNEFNYSSYQTWVNADPMDPWIPQAVAPSLHAGTAIKNQTYLVDDDSMCAPDPAPCHIWFYPIFITYRNHYLWGDGGVIFNNIAYPSGTECSCYAGILKICPAQNALPASARTLSSASVTRRSRLRSRRSPYKGINAITGK